MSVLAAAAGRAPDGPGVYYFLDDGNRLLYVGKATSLRKRLQQHAQTKPAAELDWLSPRYKLVYDVRWEASRDEDGATAREADVVAALHPPYNAWASGGYSFICAGTDGGVLSLRLVTEPPSRSKDAYGAFPHLGKGLGSRPGTACSDGYSALLRLLWAAAAGNAGAMPARLTQTAPPSFSTPFDAARHSAALHAFFSGTSARMVDALLEQATTTREPYMLPALRRDRDAAAAFFRYGPKATRAFRLRHGRRGVLSRADWAALVTAELTGLLGDFTVPRQRRVAPVL